MGMFSGYSKGAAQNVYTQMRPYLAQKDGLVHVVMRILSATKNIQRKLILSSTACNEKDMKFSTLNSIRFQTKA